jgi:hypothetical protein
VPDRPFATSFRCFLDRLLVYLGLYALILSVSLQCRARGAYLVLRHIPANEHSYSTATCRALLRVSYACLYAANLIIGLCATYNKGISDSFPNDRELVSMAWRIRSIGASESPTYGRPNVRQRPLQ